ncbi:MAG: T9SS type A sorting domain-containing protein [Calditrichaeota bacterium]|nr:T9SS type A sorting domain-containing protein [Calditrichota bacterium]
MTSSFRRMLLNFFILLIFGLGSYSLWAVELIPLGPIVINGKSDTTISALSISNPSGNGITITNSRRIRIEFCNIGPCSGEGVSIYNSSNITVVHNKFNHVRTGVYAQQSQSIVADSNYFKNIQGPFPRGQFVQYNQVTGPGNRINYNIGENLPGESYPEDAINLFESTGLENDPIQVIGNKIRGGGPSRSGGGIMTGDDGGGYIIAKDNILVDPGQYGIAVAGGHDIQLLDNLIYAKQQSFTNVGIYVWDQFNSNCNTIIVSGNQVNWTNSAGNHNPTWNAGNCGPVEGWSNNVRGANIDSTILPADLEALYDNTTAVNEGISSVAVRSFALYKNFPNPFNPSTTIQYQLYKTEHVTLRIFNLMAQEVQTLVDEVKQSGIYKIEWDGKNRRGQVVNTGLYVVRLEAGNSVESIKMLLLK